MQAGDFSSSDVFLGQSSSPGRLDSDAQAQWAAPRAAGTGARATAPGEAGSAFAEAPHTSAAEPAWLHAPGVLSHVSAQTCPWPVTCCQHGTAGHRGPAAP